MKCYYNEIDRFCCDWLSNLMDAGLITPGVIDDRSIADVSPDDLTGFQRCHFFAGIAGWELALRLAGWPSDRPVWTGSCPCQPFSSAGRQTGVADERHLWPAWFNLIDRCRPRVIFGEQVRTAIKFGWLDLVCDDLEGAGYTVRADVIAALRVGAPHIRQRLFWVAHADGRNTGAERLQRSGEQQLVAEDGRALFVADSGHKLPRGPARPDEAGRGRSFGDIAGRGAWADIEWLPCTDGKARPTKSGIFPLSHGFPNRVGALRGAGNAIVPQVAAEFIQAFAECCP